MNEEDVEEKMFSNKKIKHKNKKSMRNPLQIIRIAVAFVLLVATILPSFAQTTTIRRVIASPTGVGTQDGSNWTMNAMTLQAALMASTAGDQVWVAAGEYKPHVDDRTETFTIPAGVLVYGGFAGTEDALADRIGGATVLSGDLMGDDTARPVQPVPFLLVPYNASRDDNSNTVVTIGGASVTLDGLTITAGEGGNPADENQGAGLYAGVTATDATLTACTLSNNDANGGGGGAYFAVPATLTNCVAVGNNAITNGGGLWFNSGGTVINSTLYNNRANAQIGDIATNQGGGVYVSYTDDNSFNLRNSILIANSAGTFSPDRGKRSGQQVYVNNADAASDRVLVQHNLIEDGAVGIVYATPGVAGSIVQVNTIDQTDATDVFASIIVAEANYLRLVDGSLAVNAGNNDYLNNGTSGNPDDDITTDAAGEVRVQRGTVDLGAYESNIKGTQVIDFTLARGAEVGEKLNLVATTTAGLPVTFTSSNETVVAIGTGVDAGKLVPLAVGMTMITVSQSGDDNYKAATLEQTFLVWDPTIYRVTTAGDELADGSSWTTAATTLHGALGAAIAGDKIWIKAGIYKPHADDRFVTFSIPADVQVYGGFAGGEAGDFDPVTNDTRLRNMDGAFTNETILSGDLTGNDGTRPVRPSASEDQTTYNAALATYDATRTDNSYTVVKITGSYVTLNGLTITAGEGGTESVSPSGRFGGGLYSGDGTTGMTLTGCTFSKSSVGSDGGGAFFAESVTLTDCIFKNNNANDDAGGAFFFGPATLTGCTFTNNITTGSSNSDGGGARFFKTATLTNCIFANNSARDDAGGAAFFGTTMLTDCTFKNNKANDSAGGAAFYETNTLTGCTFTNNKATGFSALGGGAFFLTLASISASTVATLTNCTFAGNSSGEDGGGAYFDFHTATLTGCTFNNNSADDDAGGAYFEGLATLTGCDFDNNTSIGWGGGTRFDAGATLTNCTFTQNHATDIDLSKGGGAYFKGIATVTGCTFTENTTTGVETFPFDGGDGGGAHFITTATLTDCIFKGNGATDDGAGSYFNNTATLTGCTFTGNEADNEAGGAYFKGSTTLTGCTFTGNEADNSAGGAYFDGSTTLTGCDFNSNTSGFWGGGVLIDGAATLTNCAFANNTSVNDGGGATMFQTATVTQCTFTDNETTGDNGGGVVFERGGTVINSTFYNNTADNQGGGIFALFKENNPFNLRNSILVSNTTADVASGHQVYVGNMDAANVANIQSNLIAGGADPSGTDQGVVYMTSGSANITQTGTVDVSDATLVFASTTAEDENYLRLKNGSPAVDAGNNDFVNNAIPPIMTDAAGIPRILDGVVDLGAYESGLPQTIMFTSDDTGVVGMDIELMATASSGLTPVTFEITEGDAFATLNDNGTTLSLIGVGTVTITATQVGDADYAMVTQTQDITVTKQTQTINFTSDAAGFVGTDIELMATASSGFPVTFEITGEFETDGTTPATGGTVATLADGSTTLSLTGVGMVTITATQAGNANYVEATQTQTITVSQGTQTIRFTSDAAGVISTDIELVATASSGLTPVTFAIMAETLPDGSAATTGEVATLSSTTLSLISAGKVTITATQAGNVNYAMVTQTQEIAVSATPLTSQTITFTSTDTGNVGVPITLMATATSNLPIIFEITAQTRTSGTGDVATLDIGTDVLTLVSPGEVTITATQTGGDSGGTIYAATTETQIITVSKGIQVIAFSDPSDDVTKTVGETIPLVAMTDAMGLFVTFAIVTTPTTGVATLTDNGMGDGMGSLTLDGEGTVTVTASQGGNDTYVAAPDMTRTITVIKQTQTIDFTLADTGNVGEDIALAVTASSGLDVSFAITAELLPDGSAATAGAVATLMGSTLTLTGEGAVTVTASQDGNDTYVAATDMTQTITVSKQTQTIDFTLADNTGDVGDDIALMATASSGLDVSFVIAAELLPDGSAATAGAVATLMGTTLTLTGEGTVTVTVSQDGNDIYEAAIDVTQTMTVEAVVLGIEDADGGFVLYPNPVSGELHFSERVGEFRLYGVEGRLLETWENVRSADLTARTPGLYFVEVIRVGKSVRYRIMLK